MPDDSAGNATRPPSPVPVTGQAADAPQVNVPIDDIYASLNRRHLSDGRKPFLGNQNFNGYKATGAGNATDAQDYVTLAQVQALIAAVGGVATGRLVIATGNQIEAGYIAANGQSISRETYPALWAYALVSGNLAATEAAKTHGQYGPGNGATTFTVPNLYADNGYFIRPMASGRAIGSVQGDEFKTHDHGGVTGDDFPDHSHGYDAPNQFAIVQAGSGDNARRPGGAQTGGANTRHRHGINAQGGIETRPKNIAFPVLIKT